MNAVKVTLTSTILAAALGFGLSFGASPAKAHCPHKGDGAHFHCDGNITGDPKTFEVDVSFDGMAEDANTIGSDIDADFMDGVDGVQAEIRVGGGFRLFTGDKAVRRLWIDLGEIVTEIAEDDCPFLGVHRVPPAPGGNRCAAFAGGVLYAHTVDNAGSGGDRLLTMEAGDVGTVIPNPDAGDVFANFDLNFGAKLNPKGGRGQTWSILFNGDPSDFDCSETASLGIERTGEDTWDIFTTGPVQRACLFAHTSNQGGVTAMGTVDVDLFYTITCVDDLCTTP